MAGHSKWHNIKNKKGKEDAKRAKIFTKIGRWKRVVVNLGSVGGTAEPLQYYSI